MSIRNISSGPVEVPGWFVGWVRILDRDARLLRDTHHFIREGRVRLSGFVPSEELGPGATHGIRVFDVPVTWSGKLRVVPQCDLASDVDFPPMNAMSLDVKVPGRTPSRAHALSQALAMANGLFEKCLPGSDGSSTSGVIEALDGDYAPMNARCAAELEEGSGFVIVKLTFIAPASASDIEFPASITAMKLPETGSISVARWSFVVTGQEVKEIEPIAGKSWTRSGSGYAVGIAHGKQGWVASSEGRCGGTFYVVGYVMISPCPP